MLRAVWGALVCVCLLMSPALAATRGLLILYPDVASPERDLFSLLRAGIQSAAAADDIDVTFVALEAGVTAEEIRRRARAKGVHAVLALGRRAYDLMAVAQLDVPVTVGAVGLPPGTGVAGISLFPHPDRVLQTLLTVAPKIQRVIVVTDVQRDGRALAQARASAAAAGLRLEVHAAKSAGEAGAQYLNVLRYGNPQTDAIWILDDSEFVNGDTFSRVIEESWSRDFMVFSNVLSHVAKGALFAHYPDARALGERLTRMAFSPEAKKEIDFLVDLNMAANSRVASHLKRVVDTAQLSRFDMVLGRN